MFSTSVGLAEARRDSNLPNLSQTNDSTERHSLARDTIRDSFRVNTRKCVELPYSFMPLLNPDPMGSVP